MVTQIKVSNINCVPPWRSSGLLGFLPGLITPCDTFRHAVQCPRSHKMRDRGHVGCGIGNVKACTYKPYLSFRLQWSATT
jgi:hypothetical protein